MVFFVICSFYLTVMGGDSMDLLIEILKFLIVISVLPSILYMRMVYKKDKIEKEPVGLIIKLLIFGGLSVIPIGFFEFFLDEFVKNFVNENLFTLYNFIQAFFAVALVEEGIKFIILKLATWRNNNFNYTFDGIVYAVAVGLGFATIENIFYVLSTGVMTALLRAFISIPGHLTFGVLMGIFYSKSKVCERNNDYLGKTKNMMLSLMIPLALHGFFDFFLLEKKVVCLLLFGILLISIYVILFRSLNKYSNQDKKIEVSSNSFEDYTVYEAYISQAADNFKDYD